MASKPRDRDRAEAERRRKIASDYARRHPERAREERALRKAHGRLASLGNYREATPETLTKAAQVHQGALARLYQSGAITIDQLAASQEIRGVHERIGRDVAIGTMSMETRVDQSRGDGTFFEKLGAVRAEVAYTRWRASLKRPMLVLAMIAEDAGIEAAAARHHATRRTARKLLSAALDAWSDFIGRACEEIDEATVLAAQAGVLA